MRTRRPKSLRLSAEPLEARIVLAANTAAEVGSAVPPLRPDAEVQMVTMAGDLNDDGTADAHDIDMLALAIRTSDNSSMFDLDGNDRVDWGDMDTLVTKIIGVNFGDSNLDGDVNIEDLSSWMSNRFEAGRGWSGGDFNGDGLVDVSDFGIWNQGRSAVITSTAGLQVLAGDVNFDAAVTAEDIDMLSEEIRMGSDDLTFDLNKDGAVTAHDRDYLVETILATKYGDANLDGTVDLKDFEDWHNSRFMTDTTWAQGNFDGDNNTDVSDLSLWVQNRTPTTSETITATGTSQAWTDIATSSTSGTPTVTAISSIRSGDLNGDTLINASDIDVLSVAIRGGLQDSMFDLDENDVVDHADMDTLIYDVIGTNYGDANLDGVVAEADRAIWASNRFRVGTGWATGDFNGDGHTDVSDFAIVNFNQSYIQERLVTRDDGNKVKEESKRHSVIDRVFSQF